MANFEGSCPYCGQVNLSGEDPRLLCGCHDAVKFRRTVSALRETWAADTPDEDEDTELLACFSLIAHNICLKKIDSAALKLSDGAVLKIGKKVSWVQKIEREEKV